MMDNIDIDKAMTDYEKKALGIGASPEEKKKADAMTPLEILDAWGKHTQNYIDYLDGEMGKLDIEEKIVNRTNRLLKMGFIIVGGIGIGLSLLLFIWALMGHI